MAGAWSWRGLGGLEIRAGSKHPDDRCHRVEGVVVDQIAYANLSWSGGVLEASNPSMKETPWVRGVGSTNEGRERGHGVSGGVVGGRGGFKNDPNTTVCGGGGVVVDQNRESGETMERWRWSGCGVGVASTNEDTETHGGEWMKKLILFALLWSTGFGGSGRRFWLR
ncbi:uncharacterized protein BDZ99DRAFT_500599 [Mytilinidion resinicola]|uniref:Uncharacterized protein n=1 Tax=Mytilinidion resinicola TaxID=574789 RepID=A0A6A6YHC2_9PEZI|nr:uncharacterized protein BDZ99DRAFT_500599 [Mytilinidion resinicola]KAF2807394.1 hypothetical protein BDZ99DRAFT_500599 [Mytilinidion resinicola]